MIGSSVYLILSGHDFYNEVQTMTQVFYPNRKYIQSAVVSADCVTVVSELRGGKCAAFVYEGGLLLCAHEEPFASTERKYTKNLIKVCIYKALSEHTGIFPKWGALTGIRPAKLARELLGKYGEEGRVVDKLEGEYLVSVEKAELAVSVAKYAVDVLGIEEAGDVGAYPQSAHLYVGIPFCPTTCLYCSFTSYPIGKYGGRASEYLDCLKMELEALPKVCLRSVYIGGGTPTSLDESLFELLLSTINGLFRTEGIEYTVEGGRPDTISMNKLKAMKEHGVNRISINPQTMNSQTLKLIGRQHTPEDIEESFKMARASGFDNINMDLIIGLPGETVEMVRNTMERISYLSPDSITVHTLAVKRASRLNESLSEYRLGNMGDIEEMLLVTREYAERMKMLPYSMYRQKNMLGSFENVGYCKKGKHSVFNIETLEETGSILAAGAGAVSKIVSGDKIRRVFNVKNVDEYVARIEEIVRNKSALKLD